MGNMPSTLNVKKYGMMLPAERVAMRDFLKRQRGNRCTLCRCGGDVKLTIHHVWPRKWGGSNEPTNLALLCGPCHRHIERYGFKFPDRAMKKSAWNKMKQKFIQARIASPNGYGKLDGLIKRRKSHSSGEDV